MPVISIIGPKGGIGKTTLSLNTAAALVRALPSSKGRDNQVCLVVLDLRLPTLSSLMDSHPLKTCYDLFETLAKAERSHANRFQDCPRDTLNCSSGGSCI